jgi:cobalt transporter subunit CbtB
MVARRVFMTARLQTASVSLPQRVAAGAVLLLVGAALLFVVGFSGLSLAHNTAHDTRHAIGFPCH